MRINRYIAVSTGMSRRAADEAINSGRVTIDQHRAGPGDEVLPKAVVKLDNQIIKPAESQTIMLNKPVGYVCSRQGQGSQTMYDLLPKKYQNLKPVGRLDKDSSGLLLLTNDGQLAQTLTHPSFQKQKVYKVRLNKPLRDDDRRHIEHGVQLEDGPSRLQLERQGRDLIVTLSEGRNRQIRRTFAALDYKVIRLHRLKIGNYVLGDLGSGLLREV